MVDAPNKPLETIYINNLNEKVSINTLKCSLRSLFENYGNILQITAHKNLKMKGQAFITFDNNESSQKALESLQNYKLFDKEIKISFAKSNSDTYFTEVKKDIEPIETRKRIKSENKAKTVQPPTKKVKLRDWESLPPNNILLVQNLSPEISVGSLNEFFDRFNGFINIRYVKIRNLAFIEFDNEVLSTECLNDLEPSDLKENFGNDVILTYAKK